MGYTYTTIDGCRVEVHVAAAFGNLRAAFRAAWGLDLLITDGTRTRAEQTALYQAYLNGGTLAAAPGYSNHEEDGPRGPRALDVHDSGTDRGVVTYGTPRANWLRLNAPTYGFDPAGYQFSQTEPWHIEYVGTLDGPLTSKDSQPVQEDTMGKLIRNTDGTIYLLDEFGAVDPRQLLDPGVGLSETVAALDKTLGAAQLSNREFDLASMAARNRWLQVQKRIIDGVVMALGKAPAPEPGPDPKPPVDPKPDPEPEPEPEPVLPFTIDISRNQNGGRGFTQDQFAAFKAAGVGMVIPKLIGANNPNYPLYTELVHQDPARAAGMTLGHYIANGQVGTPAQIAKAVHATGQVRPGEVFWLDVEDWAEDGVRRWTPAECEAVVLALRDEFKPLTEQGIYLNLSLANTGGYREMMDRLGLRLWLAAYQDAPDVLLAGGWNRKPDLWQFTSSNLPGLRGIYDANLDINRAGATVWLVSDLQEALNAWGGAGTLIVDNDKGAKTTAAVMQFQRVFNLKVDGVPGPVTLAKLAEVVG